jgi:hypothetical protein
VRQLDQLLVTGPQGEGAHRLAGMGCECRRLAEGAGGLIVNRCREGFLGGTYDGCGSGLRCNVEGGDSRWARA